MLGLPAGVPRTPIQQLSAEATLKLRRGLTAMGLL